MNRPHLLLPPIRVVAPKSTTQPLPPRRNVRFPLDFSFSTLTTAATRDGYDGDKDDESSSSSSSTEGKDTSAVSPVASSTSAHSSIVRPRYDCTFRSWPVLTRSTLARYFHLPIVEAARRLGVCTTILKRRSRAVGIPRWPHRKLSALWRIETRLATERSVTIRKRRCEELDRELLRVRARIANVMCASNANDSADGVGLVRAGHVRLRSPAADHHENLSGRKRMCTHSHSSSGGGGGVGGGGNMQRQLDSLHVLADAVQLLHFQTGADSGGGGANGGQSTLAAGKRTL